MGTQLVVLVEQTSGHEGGGEGQYADFAPSVGTKETIKTLVESAPGLQAKHAEFHKSLDAWWTGNVKRLEKLPETQNVFEFRRQCIDGLSKALVPHNLLDVYQARGAVAAYIKSLDELKTLKALIREVEKQKETLIASARAKITEAEAKKLILARFKRLLTEQFDGYLWQYQRAFIAAVENLWAKYAVTTKQILAERDRETSQLDAFLTELGYNR